MREMTEELTTIEVPEEVTAVLVQEKIDPQSSKSLIAKFAPYHAQISDTLAESRNITDPEKATAQKLARTCRLELRRIRCEIENVRKDAKADACRYAKAVDGMSNVFKLLIEPEEERLEQIEKHAEIKERARIAALVEERTAKLAAVDADPSAYNLVAMDDATFDGVLAMAEKIKADRIEAERKAEAERIAKEKAETEERQRMQAENARLKAEAEAREKAIAAERAEREKAEAKAKAEAEAERKRIDAERAKERAELEAKAKAEAEARAVVERQAAEDRRKADETQRRIDTAEAERKRLEEDKQHRRNVMNAAYKSLIENGIEDMAAKSVIKLVAAGSVSGMRMVW
jgi:colicin import membrane protein